MRAIDVVIAHYKANERRHIDIPEWVVDGRPMRIHWHLLTVAERVKLNEFGQNDVDVVVAKAFDAEGKPLFEVADGPKMMRAADASIVSRIAAAMLGQTRVAQADVDDAEKNSAASRSG